MSSVSMEVTLSSAEANAALQRLAEFSDDRARALWDGIGAAMVASTQMRFRGQHDPAGDPWKPSERVLRHGGATLIEHGYLLASQTHNVLDDGVEWGSALVYAAIHQTGGDIHREAGQHTIYRKVSKSGELGARFVKKKQSNFAQDVTHAAYDIHIPARPYLGIDAADEATIEGMAARHLEAALLGTSPGSIE
ncbi:MAG: phage virion morphogenesis protein [Rhizomicrobium sp.]